MLLNLADDIEEEDHGYALYIHVARSFADITTAGTNCIKIGLPGELIFSKRKGLREVLFF